MKFYKKGSVHIKGRINDYTTEDGFYKIMIGTSNAVTNHEQLKASEINPDGTYRQSGVIVMLYTYFLRILSIILKYLEISFHFYAVFYLLQYLISKQIIHKS